MYLYEEYPELIAFDSLMRDDISLYSSLAHTGDYCDIIKEIDGGIETHEDFFNIFEDSININPYIRDLLGYLHPTPYITDKEIGIEFDFELREFEESHLFIGLIQKIIEKSIAIYRGKFYLTDTCTDEKLMDKNKVIMYRLPKDAPYKKKELLYNLFKRIHKNLCVFSGYKSIKGLKYEDILQEELKLDKASAIKYILLNGLYITDSSDDAKEVILTGDTGAISIDNKFEIEGEDEIRIVYSFSRSLVLEGIEDRYIQYIKDNQGYLYFYMIMNNLYSDKVLDYMCRNILYGTNFIKCIKFLGLDTFKRYRIDLRLGV